MRGGLIALTVLLFLPLSCEKNEVLRLDPPAMPPLSREEIGYGVVNASYTHIVDKPDSQGLSLGYLRRGSVVRVLERRTSGQSSPESWVLVEAHQGPDSRGWLPEPVIDLYSSEAQAQTASESLAQ
ncbi:MAG: hypothetical protein LBU21_07730 [Treponema sp.]|nr:hypothetical protein [Treponema sp.]